MQFSNEFFLIDKIPACVLETLEILNSQGFKSYLVGGCIRDLLRGEIPKDWDICTSALSYELTKVFPDCIPLGLKFGTIGIPTQIGIIQITSFREELFYHNHRHPQVCFVQSLQSDLKRRDFTINAMAYHPKEGLIDLFGGQNHLKSKILQCVGDPLLRFNEDALRILRLVRFSCTLGFTPDPLTLQQAKLHKNLLLKISKERVRDELISSLQGNFFVDFFKIYFEIFQVVLPELKKAKKHKIKNLALLFAFLFQKEEDSQALERLKFPKAQIKRTKELLKYKNISIKEDPITIKLLLRDIGYDSLMAVLELQKLDGKNTKKLYEIVQEIMIKDECFCLKDLKIKGNDLIKLGFKGKEVGKTLQKILEKVIQGEIENTPECLLAKASYFFSRI